MQKPWHRTQYILSAPYCTCAKIVPLYHLHNIFSSLQPLPSLSSALLLSFQIFKSFLSSSSSESDDRVFASRLKVGGTSRGSTCEWLQTQYHRILFAPWLEVAHLDLWSLAFTKMVLEHSVPPAERICNLANQPGIVCIWESKRPQLVTFRATQC